MAAKILLGPVVGLVETDKAIILLEIDREQTVSMAIRAPGDPSADVGHKVIKELPANRPRAFVFKGLQQDTRYVINIDGVDDFDKNTKCGEFRTFPDNPQKIKLGVVSCDFPEQDIRVVCGGVVKIRDMWKRLHGVVISQNVHAVLHIGDNVYMDGEVSSKLSNKELRKSTELLKEDREVPYVRARLLLQGQRDADEWEQHREEILEIYRQRYRDTWGKHYTKKVLSSCSNLMILDDHEIRDDFGLLEEDGDPSSKEYWLGKLAMQVYHEYQRQLWDPEIISTNKADDLHSEFYTIKLGPLAIAMIDARTPDSIYKPKRQPGDLGFYGNEQKGDFHRAFMAAENKDVRMWVVSCGVPLLFFPDFVNSILKSVSKTDDDLEVFSKRTKEDIKPIWQVIRDWKAKKGRSCDCMIVAGDVHVGGFTDIFCPPIGDDDSSERQFLCRQLTTSPIHQKGWSDGQLAVGRVALEAGKRSLGELEYSHHGFVNTCNFAVIDVDFSRDDTIAYDAYLIKEYGMATYKRSEAGSLSSPGFFRRMFTLGL